MSIYTPGWWRPGPEAPPRSHRLSWGQNGGIYLDGTGDIAQSSPNDCLADMVRTRLRARLQGWQLYAIGADLATLPGTTCDATAELMAQRMVTAALSNSFLPQGSFQVQTTRAGGQLNVYVFLSNTLLAQATVDTSTGAPDALRGE